MKHFMSGNWDTIVTYEYLERVIAFLNLPISNTIGNTMLSATINKSRAHSIGDIALITGSWECEWTGVVKHDKKQILVTGSPFWWRRSRHAHPNDARVDAAILLDIQHHTPIFKVLCAACCCTEQGLIWNIVLAITHFIGKPSHAPVPKMRIVDDWLRRGYWFPVQ